MFLPFQLWEIRKQIWMWWAVIFNLSQKYNFQLLQNWYSSYFKIEKDCYGNWDFFRNFKAVSAELCDKSPSCSRATTWTIAWGERWYKSKTAHTSPQSRDSKPLIPSSSSRRKLSKSQRHAACQDQGEPIQQKCKICNYLRSWFPPQPFRSRISRINEWKITSAHRNVFHKVQNCFCFRDRPLYWQSLLFKQEYCHRKTSQPSSTSSYFQGKRVLPRCHLSPEKVLPPFLKMWQGRREIYEYLSLTGDDFEEGQWSDAWQVSCAWLCFIHVLGLIVGACGGESPSNCTAL